MQSNLVGRVLVKFAVAQLWQLFVGQSESKLHCGLEPLHGQVQELQELSGLRHYAIGITTVNDLMATLHQARNSGEVVLEGADSNFQILQQFDYVVDPVE